MPGTVVIGETEALPFFVNETDTLAGTSAELLAPYAAYVNELVVVVQKTVTTGGTVKVAVGTTDVVGAVITVADGAVKGTIYRAKATQPSSTRAVAKAGRLQVIPDVAFATAGAVSGYVEITGA